ncbi:hypothetical protein [Saccharomonospora halophila]|uniref:hypothetical protein n=1 Tax=Saccharomonospora halophila TaxID=129922 RepID=UPI0003A088D6|nr:hypothetical protein [Saccharomonospora halophila]
MLRRAPRADAAERLLLFLLAAAFAGTAGVHIFLAEVTSAWWPLPVAVVLASAASWCLAAAVRWHHHGTRG